MQLAKVAKDAENLVNSLGDLMKIAGTAGQVQNCVQKMGEGITDTLTKMLNEEKESLTQHGCKLDDDDAFFTESVMENIENLVKLCTEKMSSFADDLPSFDLGLNLTPEHHQRFNEVLYDISYICYFFVAYGAFTYTYDRLTIH